MTKKAPIALQRLAETFSVGQTVFYSEDVATVLKVVKSRGVLLIALKHREGEFEVPADRVSQTVPDRFQFARYDSIVVNESNGSSIVKSRRDATKAHTNSRANRVKIKAARKQSQINRRKRG